MTQLVIASVATNTRVQELVRNPGTFASISSMKGLETLLCPLGMTKLDDETVYWKYTSFVEEVRRIVASKEMSSLSTDSAFILAVSTAYYPRK